MMLVAYFLFATLDTSVKWMLGLGFSALQLAFLRYAGHFVISLGEAAIKGGHALRVPRELLPKVFLRGSLLVASTVGNFIALKFLSLTVTSAIMFSAPILVCFLAGPLMGERVGPWRWAAILLGFVGVLVVIQPFGEEFQWIAFLCLINALGMALYSIMTRMLAGQVSAGAMQLYSGGIGTVVLLPVAFATWEPSVDPFVLFLWAGLGLCGWAGHELLTRAHALAPASTLMPFSYSFLLYLIVLNYIVFTQAPSVSTIIGAVIIVFAGLVIWQRERSAADQAAAEIVTR